MEEVLIDTNTVEKARKKAFEMGELNNSITRGQGSLAGFVGEEVVRELLDGVEKNTYDYDLLSKTGKKVEVKTKRTGYTPKDYYECSIAKYNTKQKCDYYVFVRVHNDLTKAWILGCYPKENYLKNSKALKKGDVDPSNNFTVKADCYNMAIKDLYNMETVDG